MFGFIHRTSKSTAGEGKLQLRQSLSQMQGWIRLFLVSKQKIRGVSDAYF
nr:hypothetical protein [uncultured bacterium]